MSTERTASDAERATEIEARLKAATPGPWYVDGSCNDEILVRYGASDDEDDVEDDPNLGHVIAAFVDLSFDAASANADFVAASPDDIRWLLSDRAALAKRVEELEGQLDAANQHVAIVNGHREKQHARIEALTRDAAKLKDQNALLASELCVWMPAESAPQSGQHILVTQLGKRGFGICGGKWQDMCAVVHYWPVEGEEGFYLSLGNDENSVQFTHWRWLEAPVQVARAALSAPAEEANSQPTTSKSQVSSSAEEAR